MKIDGVGIDAKAGPILEDVAAELATFRDCGFEMVELSVHDLDLVLSGRLQRRRMEEVVALVRQFPFAYTMHAADRTNLAFSFDLELEKDVLAASIELSAAVGARSMVYHCGMSAFGHLRWPGAEWPTLAQMIEGQQAEARALAALMPLAEKQGVTVAMENANYSGYELASLRQAGLPPSVMPTYFADLYLSELVRQVRRVNHPNLALTLDVGHLLTTARPCGFDYLEAIREAAPYIRHLHIHDNFGRPDGPFHGPRERNTHGEGDLHLPPGWGDVPLLSVFHTLPDFQGPIILELGSRYRPYYRESRDLVLGYLGLKQ